MVENRTTESAEHEPARANTWLVVIAVVLVAAAVFSFAYAHSQTQAVSQLAGNNQQMSATISDMRAQLDAVNQKLTTMTPPPAPAEPQTGAAKPAAKRSGVSDRRLKQFQSELSAQKEELQRTETDLAEARTGLYGELNSTRSELNGSIARTHDELVALEQRGERNYFEFDLTKGKTFSRSGPISISVRRTDTKHNNYDAVLLVDDNKLEKKHVNLYEPVWIHQTDQTQPVQLVVNKIDRNHVKGYVSAPKYAQSRANAGATTTPASLDLSNVPASTPAAASSDSQPSQPSTQNNP